MAMGYVAKLGRLNYQVATLGRGLSIALESEKQFLNRGPATILIVSKLAAASRRGFRMRAPWLHVAPPETWLPDANPEIPASSPTSSIRCSSGASESGVIQISLIRPCRIVVASRFVDVCCSAAANPSICLR